MCPNNRYDQLFQLSHDDPRKWPLSRFLAQDISWARLWNFLFFAILNADIISGLYKGVNESLTACGVKQSNTFTTYVPGKTKIKNYLDIKYIHYILLFFLL